MGDHYFMSQIKHKKTPAHADGATSFHASSPGVIDLDPDLLGAFSPLYDAQVPAPLSDLKDETMKCLRDLDGCVELIRHDIKTLRNELRQEFAALKQDVAKQFDLIHSKLSEFSSAFPCPVVASPTSPLQQQQPQRQQYLPPCTSEFSASQPELVNRMLKRKKHPEDVRINAENVSSPRSPVHNKKEVNIICAIRGDFGRSVGWRYPDVDATCFLTKLQEGCGYNELIEKLCEKLDIDRRLHGLYLTASFKGKSPPVPIEMDEDVEWLISVYANKRPFPPILLLSISK